jgi:hypothetical protein
MRGSELAALFSARERLPVLARFCTAAIGVRFSCGLVDDSNTEEMRFRLGETSGSGTGVVKGLQIKKQQLFYFQST